VPIKMFISILITGFAIGVIAVVILRKASLRYRLLLNQQGMPLVGGVAAAIVFIALSAVFIYPVLKPGLKGIIFSSLLMFLFGIIDDRRELSVVAKFAVQVVATGVLMVFGVRAQIVYIGNILNTAITFLWMIGITNAFNHLDVSDGLATGTTIMIGLSLFIIAFTNHDPDTALLALVVTASALSCFAYNFPPAKIYLGNAGSHFLGFLMAGIALTISYAPLERKVALFSPLVIFGLPIIDTAFLVLARLQKKKLPFNKSDDHPALRLLARGYSKKKTLLVMLTFCFAFCFFGTLLSQVSNILGAIILFIIAAITLFFLRKVSSRKVKQATIHG